MLWFFDTKDCRRNPLRVNRVAQSMYGVTGPLRGIVNRHRVWSICEQLGES